MKRLYKLFSAFMLIALSGTMVRAQEEVSDLIKSSPDDAMRLANAYLTPLFKGFGTGITQGWYNTAKTKGTGRFDLRLSVSGAFVPTSGKTFDVTKLGLSSKVSVASGGNIAQTLSGEENATSPTLQIKDNNGNTLESFTLPKGTGLKVIPAPQLQASLGLPKGIDISLRYLPEINISDDIGKVDMLGGGVKVDILQLFSKAGKILPFSLSLAAGYSEIEYSKSLNVPPPSATSAIPADPSQANKDFTTQRIDAKFSGVNLDAILSKRLLFFTPYVSVGFSNSKTDVGLLGNYPIISGAVISGATVTRTYTTFTDPIKINQTDISGVRASLGFQLSLAIFKIYGSYHLGEYKAVNAGIGLGI